MIIHFVFQRLTCLQNEHNHHHIHSIDVCRLLIHRVAYRCDPSAQRCRCHGGYRGKFPIYLQISSLCLERDSFIRSCPAARVFGDWLCRWGVSWFSNGLVEEWNSWGLGRGISFSVGDAVWWVHKGSFKMKTTAHDLNWCSPWYGAMLSSSPFISYQRLMMVQHPSRNENYELTQLRSINIFGFSLAMVFVAYAIKWVSDLTSLSGSQATTTCSSTRINVIRLNQLCTGTGATPLGRQVLGTRPYYRLWLPHFYVLSTLIIQSWFRKSIFLPERWNFGLVLQSQRYKSGHRGFTFHLPVPRHHIEITSTTKDWYGSVNTKFRYICNGSLRASSVLLRWPYLTNTTPTLWVIWLTSFNTTTSRRRMVYSLRQASPADTIIEIL